MTSHTKHPDHHAPKAPETTHELKLGQADFLHHEASALKTTIIENDGKIPPSAADQNPGNAKNLQTLIISLSIIFAGIIIAAGIFFSNIYIAKNFSGNTSGGAQTGQVQQNQQAGDINELIKNVPAANTSDHIRGDKNAPVVLIEYSDLDCPYCQQFHDTLKQIKAAFGDKVAWVYRQFPLQKLHPYSFKKSVASECAEKLGGNNAFWYFVDEYFKVQDGSKPVEEFTGLAAKIGISKTELSACVNSSEFDQKINAQTQEAASSGAPGTPFGILIKGDQRIPLGGAYPFDVLKNQIDEMLK